MSNITVVATFFWVTAAFAQQAAKQTPPPAKPAVTVAKSEVTPPPATAQLEKRVLELEKELKELKGEHEWLQKYAFENISGLQHSTVSFDPSSPGPYQMIDSSIGPLLVSLGKAEQYLDGYNVQLQIGNTTAASLKGVKISAKWARRYKTEDGAYFDWYKNRKTKDFSFTGTLLTGHWSAFPLILPDTKPSEFGYLEVSIDTNTVSMPTSSVTQ